LIAAARSDPVIYRILMIDHYHAPDPDEGAYQLRETFPTLDAAVARAEEIMDQELRDHAEAGMNPAQIISAWRAFGETPIVITPIGEPRAAWSAQPYAEANAARFVVSRQPL
jgi:hypothetical protein